MELTSSLPPSLPVQQAAAHIHRYLTLDESILLETSADTTKGTPTNPLELLHMHVRGSVQERINASEHP